MDQQIIWREVTHPDINKGYLVSPEGYIKAEGSNDEYAITKPSYQSTNGYDFVLLNNKDGNLQLFPLDEIVAIAYVHIPSSLKEKIVKVSHINGDTRDISLDNLEWVEDIEEWKVCTYPGVKPDMYEVSSWGRVRNRKTGMLYSQRSINSRGYNTLTLLCDGSGLRSFVRHRLICWEMCSRNTIEHNEVNHIDGIKTHNSPKNLEWVNHDLNMKHASNLNMINHAKGYDNGSAKLNEDIVHIICKEFIKNWGNAFNVYKTMINNGYKDITLKEIQHIKHKECWSWISDKYWSSDDLIKLHFEKIHIICKTLVSNSMDVNKTFEICGKQIPLLTKRFVQIIKYKESYKDISDKYF